MLQRPERPRLFYGWIVVAVAFVTMAIGVNTRPVFSLLFPPILAEFQWDRGVTAAAFSIGFVSAALYAPLIGYCMDRFGPRLVIPAGAVLVSIGLALATLSTQPWHFYLTLGVLVVGASTLLSYIGHMVFLPNWFARRRGLAMGIAFSGVGIGGILLLPLFQIAIDGIGWRQGCWAFAVLLLVVVVPMNALLQRRRPEDLGLRPDGDPAPVAAKAKGANPDNVVDPAWTAIDWTIYRAARTIRFWLIAGGYFGAMFAWYAILVHQTKYLLDLGVDAGQAALALGFVSLFGVLGQPALGHLSDRIGREWVWTISVAGFAAAYALLLVMQQQPGLVLVYLMVAAQGLFGYGLAAVYGAVAADIFQGPRYGTIFGTVTIAGSAGAAAGPWLTGALFDLTGSYASSFQIAIGLCLVSALLIWLAAPRKVRVVAGRLNR